MKKIKQIVDWSDEFFSIFFLFLVKKICSFNYKNFFVEIFIAFSIFLMYIGWMTWILEFGMSLWGFNKVNDGFPSIYFKVFFCICLFIMYVVNRVETKIYELTKTSFKEFIIFRYTFIISFIFCLGWLLRINWVYLFITNFIFFLVLYLDHKHLLRKMVNWSDEYFLFLVKKICSFNYKNFFVEIFIAFSIFLMYIGWMIDIMEFSISLWCWEYDYGSYTNIWFCICLFIMHGFDKIEIKIYELTKTSFKNSFIFRYTFLISLVFCWFWIFSLGLITEINLVKFFMISLLFFILMYLNHK